MNDYCIFMKTECSNWNDISEDCDLDDCIVREIK